MQRAVSVFLLFGYAWAYERISMNLNISNQTKSIGASLALFSLAVIVPANTVYAASSTGLAHGQGNGLSKSAKTETAPDDTQSTYTKEAPSASTHESTSAAQPQKNTPASAYKTGAQTTVQAKGNNGTLKIHEAGTPVHTESNDPKVCSFNVEGFGFDAGQTGYLKFDVQGGDKPTGVAQGPFTFGNTDASGYYASPYFALANGHYKATLYGKQLPSGALTDVKAKSKVFKVSCTVTTSTPVTPGVGGDVASAADQNGKVLAATTNTAELANTGQSTWMSVIAGAVVAAIAVAVSLRKPVRK
jgi:LPXTG-motif cell wall-anchored protein